MASSLAGLARRPGALALAAGVTAAVLAWWHMNALEEQSRSGVRLATVLIARGYVREGTVLLERHVEVAKVPQAYLQPGALTEPKALFDERGRPAYSPLVPIREGEQILATKLATPGREGGLAPAIPDGARAVTIGVDEVSGVAGLIRPGNRVDVLVTLDVHGGGGESAATVTALQGVLVLAVRREVAGARVAQFEEKRPASGEEETSTVTLALSPAEAQVLALAAERGKVRLALRPPGDETSSPLAATTLEHLLRTSRR